MGNLEAIKAIATDYKKRLDDLPDNRTLLFPHFLRAATAQHRDSMRCVYDCYFRGIGTKKDLQEASRLFDVYVVEGNEPRRPPSMESGLYRALREGRLEAIKFILQQEKRGVNTRDSGGRTPLHSAASWKSVEVVRLLVVELGADVNAKDYDGATPLHVAARRWHAEVVRLLTIELGADVNAKDNDGATPLHSSE